MGKNREYLEQIRHSVPETFEAVVSLKGDDSTGSVGGLPFATPTAAAIALRAYVGTERLMTVKAGTYVGEGLLFADGIISCEDGVTLQTGSVNDIFENTGSYDGIDFQVLGYPDLIKVGSKNIGVVASANSLNTLTLNLNKVTAVNSFSISCNSLTGTLNNIDNIIVSANKSSLYIKYCSSFGAIPLNDTIDPTIAPQLNVHIDEVNIISTYGSILVSNISSSVIKGTLNLIIEKLVVDNLGANGTLSFSNFVSSGPLKCKLTIKHCITNAVFEFGMQPTIANEFELSGYIESSVDQSDAVITFYTGTTSGTANAGNFKNLVIVHKNNGKAIDLDINHDLKPEIDITGTLSMITTADPKVGANVTLNNIIDIPAEGGVGSIGMTQVTSGMSTFPYTITAAMLEIFGFVPGIMTIVISHNWGTSVTGEITFEIEYGDNSPVYTTIAVIDTGGSNDFHITTVSFPWYSSSYPIVIDKIDNSGNSNGSSRYELMQPKIV